MDTNRFSGIWAAGLCDISIAVVGLSPVLEGEEHDAFMSDGGGDKISLSLPRSQIKLLQQLKQNGKPVIVIVTAGSNVDISAIEPYADAILLAWYPGEQGGNAAADILFGKVSPSGRLPVTFYRSLSDIPAYDSYSMLGRTYRYYEGPVQYPFGFGLSYTRFASDWVSKPSFNSTKDNQIHFSVSVTNTGVMDGDEIVQVYVKYPEAERMPIKELKAFKRVHLAKGEKERVNFVINKSDLQKWDLELHQWKLYPGKYTIILGGNSAEENLTATLELK